VRGFASFLFLVLWLGLCLPAHGYIIINAPMTDTNASGWVLGGNPTSSQLTGNGSIDAVGSGWLRLTNNQNNQTGFAYNNTTTFDLSAGLLIQFDYTSWGGSGADGTSIFLFDAGASPFNIGAFGGSLGYSRKISSGTLACGSYAEANVNGISGGYVGIGLDEYGNFAACTEGRYHGWNNNSSSLDANTVTIRGSVLGFGNGAVGQTLGLQSYPWITSSGSSGSLWSNNSSRPGQTGSDYRRVIIQISSPQVTPPATTGIPYANVYVQYGYGTPPTQVLSNVALPQISPSQQLKVGFGASTGGATNYHEVRNLLITNAGASTSVDLGITKTAVTTGATTQITNANAGTSFQYRLTATNNGPNDIYAPGVGITDTFPANITAGTWNCSVVNAGTTTGGSTSCPNPSSGSGNLNTAVNLTKGGSVAFTVNATVNSTPPGNALTNTAKIAVPGAITDYYSGDDSATSTITSYAPLLVTKSFSPATVTSAATTSTMTVTLTNPNNIDAAGVTFTDNYPTGLKNSTAPGVNNTCGGTYTYGTGTTGSLKLTGTGNTIPANGSCSISIKVQGGSLGSTYTNSIGAAAVDTTTANIPSNAVAATAAFSVMATPTISKLFSPTQVGLNVPSLLSVTINNPNGSPINGAQFTDGYPTSMVKTGGQGATITGTGCTGNVVANDGGNSLSLSNGYIPANTSCTYSTYVSAPTAGTYNNTTPALTTTNSGNLAAGSVVPLTVLKAPTATVAFTSPGTILPGGTSVMTITLANPNTSTAITGAAFSASYPANLFNTAALNAATTCSGGTASATNTGNGGSSGTLSLGGATIPANGSCTVTVTVTSSTPATYAPATGTISTGNAGNAASASGNLVVMAPLSVRKYFTPSSIAVGGTSVLSIELSNPNDAGVTGVGFTDSYPTTPSNLKNTTSPQPAGGYITGTGCNSGTVTAAASGTSFKWASGTVPPKTVCTLSVNVTITADGTYTNNIPVGTVGTTNAGSNTIAASANLNGPQAPTLGETFADTYLASGDDTSLTLTIGNTNGVAISLTSAFTDTLPAGMTIKTAGNTGTCSGVTASAGAASFTMANGSSIPIGGCTIVVNVTSTTPGAAVDSINAGDLKTTMGNNAAASTGTMYIYAPPAVTKTFNPATISYGGTSTMIITVSNPGPPAANPGNITGVSIADNYTGTLTNTTVNGVTNGVLCSGGGSATPTGGSNGGTAVGFNSAMIVPGGTCVITQSVTATSTNVNTTGAPTATGPVALTGGAASATLTVAPAAPTVSVSFGAESLASGGNTSLTLNIGNGNAGAIPLTGALTDTLPAGMKIGTAGNTGTCGGVTANAGAGSFSIASGTSIPAGGCTVIVNVTSSTEGPAVNSIAAGALQTGAGNNSAAGSDTLNVYAAPTVAVSYLPSNTIPSGGTATLKIVVTNPSTNPGTLTGVSIGDTYTGTLGNSDVGSVTCTGGGSATLSGGVKAGSSVGFTAGTIPRGESCTILQSVTATSNNTNTTGAPAATGPVALTGQTGSATLTTVQQAAPSVAMTFSPTQIEVSGQSTLAITLTNPSQNTVDIIGVVFSDSFPGGLSLAPGAVATSSCGGTTSVLSGNSGISLSGGTIPAGGSCYVSIAVTSTSTGSYTDTMSAGDVTSTNAAANTAGASAKLTVATVAAPSVTTTFDQNQIGINGTSLLSISIVNKNTTIALSGVSFTDSLPAGVNVATPSGISTGSSCGATATVAADNKSVSLNGGAIAANATCTITFNVTSSKDGTYSNGISVSSTNGGTGSAAAALSVLQPLTVTVQFNPVLTTVNNGSALIYTLYNPNNSIAINGAAFNDSYPVGPGLFNSAASPNFCGGTTNVCTTCQNANLTANLSGTSLVLGNATIAGGASCTVTVNVASSTAGSYYNANGGNYLSVSTTNAGSATVTPATLIVSGTPTLSVSKTANPRSGKPGDVITYTVVVSNPSTGYAKNVVLTDQLDPYAYLGYSSYQFTDGAVPSGLAIGQAIFDNGGGWGYAAGLDKNAPSGYDGTIKKWQIPMSGVMNPSSSFTVTYTVIIK
jgi:uncharacterized repeat protein (TIGR01451 family)